MPLAFDTWRNEPHQRRASAKAALNEFRCSSFLHNSYKLKTIYENIHLRPFMHLTANNGILVINLYQPSKGD